MNTRTNFAALALAGLMGVSSFSLAAPTFAGTATPSAATDQAKPGTARDPVADATSQAEDNTVIKTVDEGFKALRDVQAARLAIFNGNSDNARNLVADAQKQLDQAKVAVTTHAVHTRKASDPNEDYLPVDAALTLGENFTLTDKNKASIDKANQHIAKGDSKKAVDELKLANVDVNLTTLLVPMGATIGHVNEAAKLISQEKFYEANLALKAVEDGIIVDTYALDDLPQQGKAS